MTGLTEQERRAVNDFLSQHWREFTECAQNYLDEDEVADLEQKLETEGT